MKKLLSLLLCAVIIASLFYIPYERFYEYEQTGTLEGRLTVFGKTFLIDLGTVLRVKNKLVSVLETASGYIPDPIKSGAAELFVRLKDFFDSHYFSQPAD